MALIAALVAVTPLAHAAPNGGTVEGDVELSEKIGSPPVRTLGFVERMPNPIMETRKYDPTPEMVVVLVGGDVAADDQTPSGQPPRYELSGESFERLLLPVQVGGDLEIKNVGESSPILHTPGSEMLSPEPLNPGGVRTVTPSTAHQPIEIRAVDSAHLRTYAVAFEHPYFSVIDDDGEFEIEGVPPGRWTVRIWYRDGWLEGAKETVNVAAGRTSKRDLTIPPALQVESAGD